MRGCAGVMLVDRTLESNQITGIYEDGVHVPP